MKTGKVSYKEMQKNQSLNDYIDWCSICGSKLKKDRSCSDRKCEDYGTPSK